MKNKYIICDSARANRGKTTTLIAVARLLEKNPDFEKKKESYKNKRGRDEWVVFEHRHCHKMVVVQTGGDNQASFKRTEELLKNHDVAIIVCAARTKGGTCRKINELKKKYGYHLIWFSNLFSEEKLQVVSEINKEYIVQGIYELVQKLLI